MQIQGSVALVTGANRGIGRAYVQALLDRGAAKVYAAARDVGSLTFDDPRVVPLSLDVSDAAQVAAAAKAAPDVSLLINNAGVIFGGELLRDGVVEDARKEIEVNYLAPLALAQAFAPALKASRGGLVNVLSMLAKVAAKGAATYSASKAAGLMLNTALRAEFAPHGVAVVAVLPVQVETDMGKGLPEPRLTPEEVVSETLDALADGTEEVFPGVLTKNALAGFTADPKGFQAMMLGGGNH